MRKNVLLWIAGGILAFITLRWFVKSIEDMTIAEHTINIARTLKIIRD